MYASRWVRRGTHANRLFLATSQDRSQANRTNTSTENRSDGIPQVRIWCTLFFVLLLGLPMQSFAWAQPALSGEDAVIDGWSSSGEIAPSNHDARPVVLQPGEPELVVFFHANEQAANSTLRYRMQGFSEGWTETRQHVAHFWKLPPGDYRFEVQAANPDGTWPEHGATLAIQQKPFFYQTWYAIVMVCAFLLGIGAQLLRQRDQLQKGQMGMVMEERNRIASECHDTLMAGFAAVSWQLEATANLLDSADGEQIPAADSLEMARSMVSHCQAEARRIIWDLRNSDRITTKLSEALTDAVEAHRLRDDAKMHLAVQGNEVALSPSAVHHLVCIGQEAITNALRHARPSLIHVQLQFESDSLSLSVRDNGCGFAAQDSDLRAGHFGIPVMEERARKLGGTFRMTSSSSKGTEVEVTVNFNGIHQPTIRKTAVVPWIGV